VAGIGGGNNAIPRDDLTLSQLRAYSCVIFDKTFKDEYARQKTRPSR